MRITAEEANGGPGRDLSWLDRSIVQHISDDGSTILFSEHGEGGGPRYATYIRRLAEPAAIRLGEGQAMSLSPDGRWALSLFLSDPAELVLHPTGAGESRSLPRGDVRYIQAGAFLPDGKRILFQGEQAEGKRWLYLQNIESGPPERLPHDGILLMGPVTPDGRSVLVLMENETVALVPLAGGPASSVPSMSVQDTPIRFSGDGRFLFVTRGSQLRTVNLQGALARSAASFVIDQIELATGKRSLLREMILSDAAGIVPWRNLVMSADGGTIVYTYARDLSDLYLVQGLK
jgi:hypothetical protein